MTIPGGRQHVYLSSNFWSSLWIIQQPICNEIQRTEPVLYVERFVSIFTVLRYPALWPRLFLWVRGARQVSPNLRLLAPLPLFHLGHRFPALFRLEFLLQRLWIGWWANRTGPAPRLLWIDNPLYECAVGRLGETASIYHVADEVTAFPTSEARVLGALERRLLSKVTLVFAAAEQLAADKRQHHPRVHTVWNAIDPQAFAQATPPVDVADVVTIPSPRVAFVGVLDQWVDLELLETAARRLPAIHFVIVGESRVNDAALRDRPNVHLIGPRDRRVVPAILRLCSASLVPFKKIPLTERILPLKVFEALAAGILPVCTGFSKDLERLEGEGLVAIGQDRAGFVEAVARAVEDDTPERRRRLAAYGGDQTWARRWADMQSITHEFTSPRGASVAP